MKALGTGLVFLLWSLSVSAGNKYRTYLIEQLANRPFPTPISIAKAPVANKVYTIPRYQIPAGSVFCRLEDKLTRVTKVWVKIGVQ